VLRETEKRFEIISFSNSRQTIEISAIIRHAINAAGDSMDRKLLIFPEYTAMAAKPR
jgi:hypothetical protein